MNITALKTVVVNAEMRNWVFVKVETSEPGLYGWGEASLEWKTRSVVGAVEDLAPMIVGEDPRRIAEYAKLNQYHIKMLAYLVARLAKTVDGDGTLLDHSLVLYGTNMGNSNQHLHYDVPHVLVGGANGKLKGGRHLAYPTKTVPTGNLLLSVLDKFGIHRDSIGDSTGRLENL